MDIMKGDKLGRQGGSGSQEHPRMEIMKSDKLGRQSGSQEQSRVEIMKGDKLGPDSIYPPKLPKKQNEKGTKHMRS